MCGHRETAERAGLYVHFPFCRSVCPYCDFSVLIAGESRRNGFLDALRSEFRIAAPGWPAFDTIYLGGGTPSSLEPSQLESLLVDLNYVFQISADSQTFLEVNPEDVSPAVARAWRDLGIGFVSLGVQSFDDDALNFLGRGHDGKAAARAAEILTTEGFDTVSVDLIFGLPGTDVEWWQKQLDRLAELGIHHLSCYQLTVHSGTVLGNRKKRGEVEELDERVQADQFFLAHQYLEERGFEAYEVSNFANGDQHRSRHNQKYWSHQPYLGLGPSAHSFYNGRRWWNRGKLRLWNNAIIRGQSPVEGEERLGTYELALEAILLGLRTVAGVDLMQVESKYQVEVRGPNQGLIQRWCEERLIKFDGRKIQPKRAGLAVADALARGLEVIPTESSGAS